MDTFRVGWAPAGRLAGGRRAAQTAASRRRGAAARGRGAAAGPKGAVAGRPGAPQADPALVKRQEELSKSFAELQWDLGGLTYEMARRDHFRLDVLNARAAKLQEVDAELGQIERIVKLDEEGASGTCPACGAFQARGASFCWRCGHEIKAATNEEPAKSVKPAAKAKPAAEAKPKAPASRRRR